MSRYEKAAWFTLALFTVSTVLYFILFTLLAERLGNGLAAQVASSAFSLLALVAFTPLMFNRAKRSDMVTIDEEGKVTRFPYRKYLMATVLFSIALMAVILWMVFYGEPAGQAAALLPFLFIVLIMLLIVTLAVLYMRRQRKSILKPDDMTSADVLLYGPDMDERDLAIKRKARWCGFGAFWFVYVFGIMGVWGLTHYQGRQSITIDLELLPQFVFGAFILILMVDSIATIILYHRGAVDGES